MITTYIIFTFCIDVSGFLTKYRDQGQPNWQQTKSPSEYSGFDDLATAPTPPNPSMVSPISHGPT